MLMLLSMLLSLLLLLLLLRVVVLPLLLLLLPWTFGAERRSVLGGKKPGPGREERARKEEGKHSSRGAYFRRQLVWMQR